MKKFAMAFLLVTPLLFLFLIMHFRHPVTRQNSAEALARLNDVKKRLGSFGFEAVEDTPRFRAMIENVAFTNGAILSGDQSASLKASIYEMIMAFHKGTYESYRAFRTPIEASFNPKAIAYHSWVLTNFYLPKDQRLPEDPEDIARLIWEKNYGGNAFKDYWKALCVTNIRVMVEKTNKLPGDLFHFAATQDNTGIREIIPTFEFHPNPQTTLRKSSGLLYANLVFDIQPAEPDPIFPLFVRYYWNNEKKTWLPWEMTSGNSQKRKRDPMF